MQILQVLLAVSSPQLNGQLLYINVLKRSTRDQENYNNQSRRLARLACACSLDDRQSLGTEERILPDSQSWDSNLEVHNGEEDDTET